MPFLDWLPPDVTRRSTIRELAAGESLFRQGDRSFAIFEVEDGRLRLIRHTIDSREVVLHTARRGELFAEASLFSNAYQCDAVAAVRSRVRGYPKRELLAAMRKSPDIAERFMEVLARQIHGLRTRLEERNIRSARARVLHRLTLAVGADGRTVMLDGKLKDLAADLGLTHEAFYRTLTALEKEGAVTRAQGRITLRKTRGI